MMILLSPRRMNEQGHISSPIIVAYIGDGKKFLKTFSQEDQLEPRIYFFSKLTKFLRETKLLLFG